MKISQGFNRLYWGAIIGDVERNMETITWNNIKFNVKVLDKQGLHNLFKIMTLRGDKSLREMTSKDVVQYLEDIRLLLSENGFTLEIDDEDWDRLIKNM